MVSLNIVFKGIYKYCIYIIIHQFEMSTSGGEFHQIPNLLNYLRAMKTHPDPGLHEILVILKAVIFTDKG